MEPVLDIRNLTIASSRSEIVSDASLSVEKGKVVGIIGESGAGKSTVALAAIGIFRPGCRAASGSIHLCGQDVLSLSQSEIERLRRQKVAYVA